MEGSEERREVERVRHIARMERMEEGMTAERKVTTESERKKRIGPTGKEERGQENRDADREAERKRGRERAS